MEDKIAVQCFTEEEWDIVRKDAKEALTICNSEGIMRSYNTISSQCIMLDGRFNPKESCIRDGYTIITAAEYLGGKDVKEFSVGDRVECIKERGYAKAGHRGTIVDIIGTTHYVDWDDYHAGKHDCDGRAKNGYGWNMGSENIKLITKPKTTKENNMELNSSIRTVLVEENGATFETVEKFQKVFGSEIAGNFTGAMILRKNITMYAAEIKRLDDIEAKRLKEEAKKK